MHTTQFNHAPAQIFMNTGHQVIGRPSMGSWLTLRAGQREQATCRRSSCCSRARTTRTAASRCWGSGFLPTQHQGVEFRSSGDPVLFVSNPDGVDAAARRRIARRARRSEPAASRPTSAIPRSQTRISAYELAYRMQTSVPELTDISNEPRDDPRAVRHRAGQGLVRQQLPAGAAAGRARRALRAALPPRLGHARRVASATTSSSSLPQPVPRDRPGRRGAASRT